MVKCGELQKNNERKINYVEMRSRRERYEGGVSLADRILNEEIYRMADTSEDVTMSM